MTDMSDRPVEPAYANEDPEQWAEIAQWESDRADEAEAQRDRLKKALKIYADKSNWHRNGHGWMNIFHKDTNAPFIARTALAETALDELTKQAQEDGFYE